VLYGGFVETLDYHVGRLLDALDRLGMVEDTLVVFTSDNGGHPEYALNAPLRGGKWHLFEGGIRVPLLARWPGVVKAGTVAEAPVSGTDLFATFAAVAGADSASGVDSRDLGRVLRQGSDAALDERALIWHFPYYHPEKDFAEQAKETGVGKGVVSQTRPVSAIRAGRYKLLYFYDDERVELYDLKTDLGEQRDLSGERGELAKKLRQSLQQELKRVGARLPGLRFAPKGP
jgi:uncharacterized sulfatase